MLRKIAGVIAEHDCKERKGMDAEKSLVPGV